MHGGLVQNGHHHLHTVRAVPKYNLHIVETKAKLLPFIHVYMTAYSPGLVQALQLKVAVLL